MFSKVRSGVIALAVLGAIAVIGDRRGRVQQRPTGATGSQGSARRGTARSATLSHGPGETLLTDGTADKVKQAALDKVSGATVIRVETDNEGSPYEAHLQKSDGSEVTVKVDKQFNVTSVETGFGGGPPGGPHP